LKTQIPIDYQTTSRVKFYSFDLLGVLAMDCLLEDVINYSKSPNQTYKSLLHRFCSPTNGYLLPNIQLVFGILHQYFVFFFPITSTSLSPKEFDKPCLLSFSKWSKSIESIEIVQKIHGIAKQQLIMCVRKFID
jgi:hypothetical protein